MIRTSFKKIFIKDLDSLPKDIKLKVQQLVFKIIPELSSPFDIQHLKKIAGHIKHYRIRVGEYRIGLTINEQQVVFYRVLLRKDIYKYFPI